MDTWLGVEPRLLATLDAVRRHGSLSEAARSLGYAQSAVSQQISRLEAALGTRVVDRSSGRAGVNLTEVGEIVARHGELVLGGLDAARADLGTFLEPGPARLKLGVCASVSAPLLPSILARLSSEARAVDAAVTEEPTSAQLLALIRRGALDAAIVELPLGPGPYACRELLADPCALIVPAGSPLARRTERPTLSEIAALKLIVDPAWSMCELVARLLSGVRARPRLSPAPDAGVSLQSQVAAGAGAALMSRLSVDDNDQDTVAVGLAGILPERTVALAWHENRRHLPTLEQFWEVAYAACSGTPAPPTGLAPKAPLAVA